MELVLPNETEILKWILETATHAYHIEFYLQRLTVGTEDPDRPHDIVHAFNKFDWEAVKGFALQYRENGDKLFHDQIMASRAYHRNQYHHQMWKCPSPNVSQDARKLSAVDAVCSMLENRGYQKGVHTWAEIEGSITEKSAPHQIPWMECAYTEMKKIQKLNLAQITTFSKIPRQGITPETYEVIIGRAHETLRQLEQDHGYNFYKNSESIIREILK